jgi:hypothetical protein
MGVHAADLCHKRAFGQMVTLRGTKIGSIDILEAIGKNKLVDPEGPMVAAARAVDTELGA